MSKTCSISIGKSLNLAEFSLNKFTVFIANLSKSFIQISFQAMLIHLFITVFSNEIVNIMPIGIIACQRLNLNCYSVCA